MRPSSTSCVKLRDDSRRLVAGLQARYAAETGIASLKIRHNNVLGYHIEIGPNHAAKMAAGFIHRQTLASSMRYSTVELGELESEDRVRGRQGAGARDEAFR